MREVVQLRRRGRRAAAREHRLGHHRHRCLADVRGAVSWRRDGGGSGGGVVRRLHAHHHHLLRGRRAARRATRHHHRLNVLTADDGRLRAVYDDVTGPAGWLRINLRRFLLRHDDELLRRRRGGRGRLRRGGRADHHVTRRHRLDSLGLVRGMRAPCPPPAAGWGPGTRSHACSHRAGPAAGAAASRLAPVP